MRLHFRNGDEDHEIEVAPLGDRWRVTVDGETREIVARRDGAGGWLVDWEGRRRRLQVAAAGEERFVFAAGRVHRLHLFDPDAAEEEENSAGPGLRADMPGKVVRVLVAEGDTVLEGQPVLIIESMKMETERTAAVGGTVAKVHVVQGEVVAQGAALLDIEPGDEA